LCGLGGLDIIVNNAVRQQTHASILDISTEQFDWTMKTNVYAPFLMIKEALPHLQPGSVIIGSTSVQATDLSEIFMTMHKRRRPLRIIYYHLLQQVMRGMQKGRYMVVQAGKEYLKSDRVKLIS
jgi:NAD(P)-dependent dehydrogenase (short-subunit alcohol dehydrogenase family)